MSGRLFVVLTGVAGAAIGCAITFPLPLHLASAVIEDGTYDAYESLWNLWWVRASLAHGENPFRTAHLFHPDGVGLLLHTLSFPLGLVSVPLQIVLPGGVVTAHNLLIIAAPALTVVTVGLLAREVTGDPWAALVAGLLAAVNPIAVWFLPVLYLNCSYLIAAVVWAWWRMHRRRRAVDVALALALLAVLVFAAQEFAIMAVAILALDTLCRFACPRLLRMPVGWGRGTIAFWAVGGAGLAGLAVAALGVPATPPPLWHVQLSSVYAAGLVTPPWLVAPPRRFFTIFYVGTASLVLGGVALWLRRPLLRYWLVVLAALAGMALGPYIHLTHHWLPDVIPPPRPLPPSGLPSPYLLAYQYLPFLHHFRAPCRWVVALQVAVAVVAALGVAGVRARIAAGAARRSATVAIVALVLTAAAVDVRGLRAPLASTAIPPAYDALRDDPQPAAVLELPSGLVAGGFAAFHDLYMYYQTAHGKFLLEGTVARPPADRRLVAQWAITDFRHLPYVKYAIIHYDLLNAAYPASRQQAEDVETLLQTQGVLLARDERAAVYRLRTFRAEAVGRRETPAERRGR